jgi:hypothetical protein
MTKHNHFKIKANPAVLTPRVPCKKHTSSQEAFIEDFIALFIASHTTRHCTKAGWVASVQGKRIP